MLDAHSKSIVKQTAPRLIDKGLDVTLRMYELMFTANPEVKSLFNMANQLPHKQPLALAQSIHAYAANIDNLEALRPTVALIANKHASLGVKPEHYAIVGRHLLQALQEVLNLDQEQVNAWAKAYQFLADLLINTEKDLYTQAVSQEGGWEDYRTFIVDKKVKESDVITSFYLRPKDGGKLASFKPGQYVTVKLDFPGGNTVTRNYSLSDAASEKYYRISIKKERPSIRDMAVPDGLVSCYLHDYYQPGMEVQLRAPMGDFFLNPDTTRPLVLLSGGVGLTPVMSMLKTIVEKYPNQQTYFIHGALNNRTHAFCKEVKALADKHENIHAFICYNEPTVEDLQQRYCDKTGFITEEWLEQILPQKDCNYYFCGPKPFMQLVHQILKRWNVPSSQIHHEFFGPADTEVLNSHSLSMGNTESQSQAFLSTLNNTSGHADYLTSTKEKIRENAQRHQKTLVESAKQVAAAQALTLDKKTSINRQEQIRPTSSENKAKEVEANRASHNFRANNNSVFKRNYMTMLHRGHSSYFKRNYATGSNQNKTLSGAPGLVQRYSFFASGKWKPNVITASSVLARKLSRLIPK